MNQFTTEIVDATYKKTRYYRGFSFALGNGDQLATGDRADGIFGL